NTMGITAAVRDFGSVADAIAAATKGFSGQSRLAGFVARDADHEGIYIADEMIKSMSGDERIFGQGIKLLDESGRGMTGNSYELTGMLTAKDGVVSLEDFSSVSNNPRDWHFPGTTE